MQNYIPLVSVVIATFNRAESLKRCLESLVDQSYKNFEVVIVDGGSVDNTKDIISHFSRILAIKIVVEEKLLLSLVRDLCWRNASGEIVVWIDDDVVVTEEWISNIVDTFALSDNIGGVSGPTLIPEEHICYRDVFFFLRNDGKANILKKILSAVYIGFFLEGKPNAVGRIFKAGSWSPGSNFRKSLSLDGLVDVDYLEACNMAFRKNLVEKVGGIDCNYRSVSEWCEPDLSFRIRELGYRLVFNPKVIVYHVVSQSGIFKKRTFAYDRMVNFIYFYFKNMQPIGFDKLFRFCLYVLFINVYWFYMFIMTKNFNYLSGITGTFAGFINLAEVGLIGVIYK